MPFFDYKCPSCNGVFEKMVKSSDSVIDLCVLCGSNSICEKQISASHITQYNHNPKASDSFKDKLKEMKKNAGKTSTIDI